MSRAALMVDKKVEMMADKLAEGLVWIVAVSMVYLLDELLA